MRWGKEQKNFRSQVDEQLQKVGHLMQILMLLLGIFQKATVIKHICNLLYSLVNWYVEFGCNYITISVALDTLFFDNFFKNKIETVTQDAPDYLHAVKMWN